MAFFYVLPYRVLFHDTMAYGTHHFLTNFKFQCEAREHLFFERLGERTEDAGEAERSVFLTQQGYCRNLAPVDVGGRVGILLSFEALSLSSARLCFRVVRDDGAPVSCGYQTLIATDRQSGAVRPLPATFADYGQRLREPLAAPSFAERAHAGELKAIFDADICTLGRTVAASDPEAPGPRLRSARLPSLEAPAATANPASAQPGLVFTFPGQGSYRPAVLRAFAADDDEAATLQAVDALGRERLGGSLLTLISTRDRADHERRLRQCPDLAQLAMYLSSVLIARRLQVKGLRPALMVGHSVGELAALAAAGVYSTLDGARLVADRALALRALGPGVGGMLALGCNRETATELIAASGVADLQIGVVNHHQQVVVSGPFPALEGLEATAAARQIKSRRLLSPYPFHCARLAPAVAPFAASLAALTPSAPSVPVYSPLDRTFYREAPDLRTLADHLVQPLAFDEAITTLYDQGARIFVECGGGRVLSRLVPEILAGRAVEAHAPLAAGGDLLAALDQAASAMVAGSEANTATPAARPTGLPPRAVPSVAEPAVESAVELPSEPVAEPDSGAMPIAIVSLGAVLPGAADAEAFWQNILAGRSGISNAAEFDPAMARDFHVAEDVVSDKTYTLLGGFVRDLPLTLEGLPWKEAERTALSAAQRFLAIALAQCLAPLAVKPAAANCQLILGATADGIVEYDEALLAAGLEALVDTLPGAECDRQALRDALAAAVGRAPASTPGYAPATVYGAVAARLLGADAEVVAVDAACASSLYAVDLGVRALRRGAARLAFCGGVFAPGPANSCLFSQFRGLSATGSRPLDAAADGVVFGEGAALLTLKRLPDALADGDPILGVIREVGLSSDGKSPSVAVPRRIGQELAIRRAWGRSGLDPRSVQLVEAHATSTPVGDAEEFKALTNFFGAHPRAAEPIALGSVKGLIGHTGWAAGAASIIKVLKAMEAGRIPAQGPFTRPNPRIDLAASPFAVATAAQPWPAPQSGMPRRAAVDGFGFGGTNAHVILDAYTPEVHDAWRDAKPESSSAKPPAESSAELVVVALDARIPALAAVGAQKLRFTDEEAALPARYTVLPDVAEQMDRAQCLAVTVADACLARLPNLDAALREATGVVLGVSGKSALAQRTNLRIYRDFLRHRLGDDVPLASALWESIEAIAPSGPYTLPGLMPNVCAGRVANMLDLKGLNMVIDTGAGSLGKTLAVASELLADGSCRLVLAGAVQASCSVGDASCSVDYAQGLPADRPLGEAAVMLALTAAETAREHGLPMLARLSQEATLPVTEAGTTTRPAVFLRGAEGATELLRAVEAARAGKGAAVRWDGTHPRTFGFLPPVEATATPRPVADVHRATPRFVPLDEAAPLPLKGPTPLELPTPLEWRTRRVLVLTDQPGWFARRTARAALAGIEHRVLVPAGCADQGSAGIDLSSEETLARDLAALDLASFDTLLVLHDLTTVDNLDAVAAMAAAGGGLLDLLFAVARHAYEALGDGRLHLAALALGAVDATGRPHPTTGLFSGFLKALARERPTAVIKSVASDTTDLATGLEQLAAELAPVDQLGLAPGTAPVEVLYRQGVRGALRLTTLPSMQGEGPPSLGRASVVIATGGARGVTAVLMEALLRRYGCAAVLLGRSEPAAVPAAVEAMDDDAFAAYEGTFYTAERQREPGVKMPVLKARFAALRAAREVARTLARLGRFSTRVRYHAVDITDAAAVERVMEEVAERYGRLDLVVHGAGVQRSRPLERKEIGEFRRIVATKLGGLAALRRACARVFPDRAIGFHLLTSAFSVLGNDGQVDYGAANETLNRLAAAQDGRAGEGRWSSLAWLGWAGVGMTRGSEYAALARSRRLRAISAEEGAALFDELMAGPPRAAVNVVISDGELAWYDEPLDPPQGAVTPSPLTAPSWTLTRTAQPYLNDHLVRGVPTLPGTFEVELAARAARAQRPDWYVTRVSRARFLRFVKVGEEGVTLRSEVEVTDRALDCWRLRVRLVSDFVHKSGRMLRRAVPHFEAEVELRPAAMMLPQRDTLPSKEGMASGGGRSVDDPYLAAGSAVQLQGIFRCLHDIELGADHRRAVLRFTDAAGLEALADFLTPAVLFDATCRCAMIHRDRTGTMPLYVPVACGITYFRPGAHDVALHRRPGPLVLTAATPRLAGERIYNAWAQITDAQGEVVLALRDLEAQQMAPAAQADASASSTPQPYEPAATSPESVLVSA